jgi:hypothetical protein
MGGVWYELIALSIFGVIAVGAVVSTVIFVLTEKMGGLHELWDVQKKKGRARKRRSFCRHEARYRRSKPRYRGPARDAGVRVVFPAIPSLKSRRRGNSSWCSYIGGIMSRLFISIAGALFGPESKSKNRYGE